MLAIAAFWAHYLLTALWRDVLWRRTGASFEASFRELGLEWVRAPHPVTGALWAGWKSSLDASGVVDGWTVSFRLTGGVRGERYVMNAKGPGGRVKAAEALSEVGDPARWVREQLTAP